MANDYSGPVWVIDTAAADVLTHATVTVSKIRWIGGTTAGHQAIVQDAAGKRVAEFLANAANFQASEDFGPTNRNRRAGKECVGLKVPTLGSGKLEIHFA